MDNLRNFEISVWTLQDEFITVIEDSNNKLKGKTQNASINLNVDGTQELTFTIPMRISKNGELINNPAWQNAKGSIIINTRKIKVILNKKIINGAGELENENTEEIYEFVVEKMTERHEEDQLYCDVVATGLAFYELGKIGYKISLSSEDFYADDLSWFKKEKDEEGRIKITSQPIANIQYWVNKFLPKLENEDNILDNNFLNNTWYYTLQMNWENHFNYPAFFRSAHKIYEDTDEYKLEFTAMTTDDPNDQDAINQVGAIIYDENQVRYEEKARLVDLEESNIYNLTQNIAEIFGVYCKYQYIYDDYYHIIGRVVIFYNNFLYEDKPLSIEYKNQTSSISRELDTADLVTKMYVKTVDENDEMISIIDVVDNPTGEDFLLNFDYMHSIGTIDDYQYSEIPIFQKNLKEINEQIRPLQSAIAQLENDKIDLEAQEATLEVAVNLDAERIDQANALYASLTNDRGTIQVTAAHPDSAVLHLMNGGNSYYINLSEKGIKPNTIKLFRNLVFNSTTTDRVTNPVNSFRKVFDEFGNLVQLDYISKSSNDSNVIYLTYEYEPRLYWDNVKAAWENRLENDTRDLGILKEKIENLNETLGNLNKDLNKLLEKKKELLEEFNITMGSAIREGYWQPENYTDTGDSYVSTYSLNKLNDSEKGASDFDYFKWDNEIYDNELDAKYTIGVNEQTEYYYGVILNTPLTIFSSIKVFPYENEEEYVELAGSCSLGMWKNGGGISFGIIFNNVSNFSNEMWDKAKAHPVKITGKLSEQDEEITINLLMRKMNFINDPAGEPQDISLIYPRIFIEASSLKTSEDQLAISTPNENLINYQDYYILSKYIESPYNTYIINGEEIYKKSINYVITLKPEAIIPYLNQVSDNIFQFSSRISIFFTISNADSAIYNDAKEILRESSIPKVAYEIAYNIFNNSYLFNPNSYLNHIVDINDVELQFHNVRGYVSGITIDLDHPWNDTLEIKNYRTKFEDLFTTIFAQTEAMKSSSYIIENMSQAFSVEGQLKSSVVQETLLNKDLNFAFNQGSLTINETDGIWGTSDAGVVAFRGGGIFTATKKDDNDNWLWNTGITPEGINASLITTGQLDTNRIKIYAGDRLNFQFNEEGLFAYKSFMHDFDAICSNASGFEATSLNKYMTALTNDATSDAPKLVDPAQYVKFDKDGLFLTIKSGAWVLKYNNGYPTDFVNIDEDVDRVEISWRGLILRNNKNIETLFADPETGNLNITGTITATSGAIGGWKIGTSSIYMGNINATIQDYNNSENPEDAFDEDLFKSGDIIYFGKRGLSFNNIFKVSVQNNQFQEFAIKRSTTENDYLLKFYLNNKNNDNNTGSTYALDIQNATFGYNMKEAINQMIDSSFIGYREIIVEKNTRQSSFIDEEGNTYYVDESYYVDVRHRKFIYPRNLKNGALLIENLIDLGNPSTAINTTGYDVTLKKETTSSCNGNDKNVYISGSLYDYFNIYYNDDSDNNLFYFGLRNNISYGVYFYILARSDIPNITAINITITQSYYNGNSSYGGYDLIGRQIIFNTQNNNPTIKGAEDYVGEPDGEGSEGLEPPLEEIEFTLSDEENDDSRKFSYTPRKKNIIINLNEEQKERIYSTGLIVVLLPDTSISAYCGISLNPNNISLTYYNNDTGEKLVGTNMYVYFNGSWDQITYTPVYTQ